MYLFHACDCCAGRLPCWDIAMACTTWGAYVSCHTSASNYHRLFPVEGGCFEHSPLIISEIIVRTMTQSHDSGVSWFNATPHIFYTWWFGNTLNRRTRADYCRVTILWRNKKTKKNIQQSVSYGCSRAKITTAQRLLLLLPALPRSPHFSTCGGHWSGLRALKNVKRLVDSEVCFGPLKRQRRREREALLTY